MHDLDSDIIANLTIPEGHLHRSAVLARGWKSADINKHLSSHALRIETPKDATNISNKIYPIHAVEHAETENMEMVKALAKRERELKKASGSIVRDCHTAHDPSMPMLDTGHLIGRGWRGPQIDRYLGARPDWQQTLDPIAELEGAQAKIGWCMTRITAAESADATLRRQVARVAEARQAGPNPATTAATNITTALASNHLVATLIPDVHAGAVRSWRRLITRIDRTQVGAYALQGKNLTPAIACMIEPGAIVITCDILEKTRTTILYRVTQSGLEEIKSWTTKAPIGARIVSFIEHRLPIPTPSAMIAIEPSPNRHPGSCMRCLQEVGRGEGVITTWPGSKRVAHKDTCPPPPFAPAESNRQAGWCHDCGLAVLANQGVREAINTATPSGNFRRWVTRHIHRSDCATAQTWLPNIGADWCADCGGMVREGEGRWSDHAVRHTNTDRDCAPNRLAPQWSVKTADAVRPGQTLRCLITPRNGEQPIPAGMPGLHVVDERTASAIVTVIDVIPGHRSWIAKVAPADAAASAAILAAEAVEASTIRPTQSSFRGFWQAYRIRGRDPWLAEITGLSAEYGYARTFLRAALDYGPSNWAATDGVLHQWIVRPHRVYEALVPEKNSAERMYLRVTENGDVEEITKEQVDAWILHGTTMLLTKGK